MFGGNTKWQQPTKLSIADELSSGQTLEMLSTDPGSKNDITAWTKRTGNELIETVEDGGVFKFYIKKA